MLTAGGLAQRVRARRGPMTGSGVTRRFIVGERRITRSLSSGAHSRDPLAHPPYELDVSKRTR
jgi:hypothetical protein